MTRFNLITHIEEKNRTTIFIMKILSIASIWILVAMIAKEHLNIYQISACGLFIIFPVLILFLSYRNEARVMINLVQIANNDRRDFKNNLAIRLSRLSELINVLNVEKSIKNLFNVDFIIATNYIEKGEYFKAHSLISDLEEKLRLVISNQDMEIKINSK